MSGSDGTAVHHLAVQKERPLPRIVFQLPGITFPGSIMIPLPGGTPKPPQSTPNFEHLDEYTVVTTGDTLFQDGSDCIPFEDFKAGETISIHGELKGTILTASRLAKWN